MTSTKTLSQSTLHSPGMAPLGLLRELGKAVRALEKRAATVLEVVQPGPAELSQRWQAEARGRAAAAVERALDNWEALASQTQNPTSGSSLPSSPHSEHGDRPPAQQA